MAHYQQQPPLRDELQRLFTALANVILAVNGNKNRLDKL